MSPKYLLDANIISEPLKPSSNRLQALGLQTDLSDGQIAAIAITQGLVLVTRNVAHFSPFAGLEIENWFDLS